MEEGEEGMPLPKPEPKREWSEGLSNEAVLLVETLEKSGRLGTVVDCGAGEGRHSVFASRKGAEKVIAIEKDPKQIVVLQGKKREGRLSNLEVIEGDVLEQLSTLGNGTIDGIIDCGMSHCLTEDSQRIRFASLVHLKLKLGGLYSITHFSEEETLSTEHFRTNLEGLKGLFPEDKWEEIMPWQKASWKRADGEKHHAYKAVLRKKEG